MVHVNLNVHTRVLGYTRHTGWWPYWVQFIVVMWDIRRPETPLVRCIDARMARWLDYQCGRMAVVSVCPDGWKLVWPNAFYALMPVLLKYPYGQMAWMLEWLKLYVKAMLHITTHRTHYNANIVNQHFYNIQTRVSI